MLSRHQTVISNQHHINLLTILRGSTFQSRDDFFRSAMKLSENTVAGEARIYQNLIKLENLGFVSIDRVRNGSHNKLVSIRMTEKGLFELVGTQLGIITAEAQIDMPSRMKAKTRRTAAPVVKEYPQPCGQVMKKCLHAGCYLAWKCGARSDQ